jgi:hypothetical protein
VLVATRGENGIGYLSNEAIQDIIVVSRLFWRFFSQEVCLFLHSRITSQMFPFSIFIQSIICQNVHNERIDMCVMYAGHAHRRNRYSTTFFLIFFKMYSHIYTNDYHRNSLKICYSH